MSFQLKKFVETALSIENRAEDEFIDLQAGFEPYTMAMVESL